MRLHNDSRDVPPVIMRLHNGSRDVPPVIVRLHNGSRDVPPVTVRFHDGSRDVPPVIRRLPNGSRDVPPVARRLPKDRGNELPVIFIISMQSAPPAAPDGLVHDLLSPPVAGTSWEGWVIEQLLASAPPDTASCFYRTAAGAEIDLVVELRPGIRWAIECKRSLTPTPARGSHEGCKDLQPQQKLLIYPGRDSFPLGQGVECVPLPEAVARLRTAWT